MNLVAWFRTCGCGEADVQAIRSIFAANGLSLVPFESRCSPCPYGIVCFKEANDDLMSVLQSLCRDVRVRVVALALPASDKATPVWRLLHVGSSDVLTWDGNGQVARQIIAKFQHWSTIDKLVDEACSHESIIGESPKWRILLRNIVEAAHFTTAPLLLTGESGTGKEVLAKLVSRTTGSIEEGYQPRRELVTVDCGSLIPELSGSELFGHERGAFTGAHSAREGAFANADGATLFLDEIGELPLSIQAQLLRVIQEHTYKRLGGNAWQSTNFRLVCATNRDLDDLVKKGLFRLDLYHRIAGCVFRTPPLRDRKEDILPLASHFVRETLPNHTPDFDMEVQGFLINRAYAGNIRELRQLVQRIAVRYAGIGPITAGDVSDEDRPANGYLQLAWPDERFERSIAEAIQLGVSLKGISQTAVEVAIGIVVNSEKGNLQRAAVRLGITDRALQMRRAAGRLELPGALRDGIIPTVNGG